MDKVSYNVNGLINNNVKTQIKNELEDIDGVHQVEVDRGRSQVKVEYNPPATEDTIRNSIEHVGCRVME